MNPEKYFKTSILPVKHKLYRFAFFYLKEAEEAEDAVQEVFLKIWDMQAKWADIRNMEAWCMQLTKNQCLDRLRKVKRLTPYEHAQHDHTDGSHPEMDHAWRNQWEIMSRLMKDLPELHQEVLQLREMQQMSYEDIAKVLRISLPQVKVTIHRARKALKTKMQKLNQYGLSKTSTTTG